MKGTQTPAGPSPAPFQPGIARFRQPMPSAGPGAMQIPGDRAGKTINQIYKHLVSQRKIPSFWVMKTEFSLREPLRYEGERWELDGFARVQGGP